MQLKGHITAVACLAGKKLQRKLSCEACADVDSGYVTPVYKGQHHHS